MAMMLTNDTVQLNFVEISTKVVVHQPFAIDDAVIILIDSTRAIQVGRNIYKFKKFIVRRTSEFSTVFSGLFSKISQTS